VYISSATTLASDGPGSLTTISGNSDSGSSGVTKNFGFQVSNYGNVTVCDFTKPSNQCGSLLGIPTTPNDPGGGGFGGPAIVAAAVGAVAGMVGAGRWLMVDSDTTAWALEAPQDMLVAAGNADALGKATLDYMWVAADDRSATVRLRTRTGQVERYLPLKDANNGVQHFVTSIGKIGTAELSFNPQNAEYFYRERWLSNGKVYAVQAHGWLKAV
jgi:hypothetical protein